MQQLLLSIPQTAESLALSRSTIYRLINEGAIESIMVRGIQRIRPSALQRYLDNQQRVQRERLVNFS
jgi:excisionase family DNA binding protein|uniref:helix-turn-helix domain-containing protein n=1 Tax=Candidatus Planktophila sp. TaxID=2175601 RepID=UPI00404A6ED7